MNVTLFPRIFFAVIVLHYAVDQSYIMPVFRSMGLYQLT